MWCGVVWWCVVWCGVVCGVRSGVVWCGVVWCGVVSQFYMLPRDLKVLNQRHNAIYTCRQNH